MVGFALHSTVSLTSSANYYIADRLLSFSANYAVIGVIKISTTTGNVVASKAEAYIITYAFKAAFINDLAVDA